jgi:hypothetical protein
MFAVFTGSADCIVFIFGIRYRKDIRAGVQSTRRLKMLNKIWVYSWAYLFIFLGLLDEAWENLAKIVDSKTFAGVVFAADAVILLRILGVW